jgi:acetyl-CoA carboxylase biotin carboxyl carrier protein
MKIKKVRELMHMVEESDIEELEISRFFSFSRIRIVKSKEGRAYFTSHAPPYAHAEEKIVQSAHSGGAAAIETPPDKDADNIKKIVSPMVGTFYRSPSPDAEPFVEENQIIEKGHVVCIVEAMKLMNEIESEYEGEIVDVHVENSQPVQYNQPLFSIKIAD